MGNSCGSMCNGKNHQNEAQTESKIAGWGTSANGEEVRKSPTKNAQPKAQAGFNSNSKGGNTAVSHEFSNEEDESETTIQFRTGDLQINKDNYTN